MMATQDSFTENRLGVWLRRLAPGLIAGMVFAMWAMVVGIFTPASNFWAPPQGIAQAVGIGHPGHDFQVIPFVLGLLGHMMNSVVLGAVFVAVALLTRLRRAPLVIAGMIYGPVLYLVMYYPILRGLLSRWSQSFLSSNPEWSWVVAHLMFGLVLGALLAYWLPEGEKAAMRRVVGA